MIKEDIKEIKDRWHSRSPKLFRRLTKLAITLGTSAVAVIASDKMFDLQSYGVPQNVFTVAGYVIVFCAALGLTSKITREYNDEYKQ